MSIRPLTGMATDPYMKSWITNLNQVSASDPTVYILHNTIGHLTSARISPGLYRLIGPSGTFPENRTWCIIAGDGNNLVGFKIWRYSDTEVRINTLEEGNATDGLLIDTNVEIRVYTEIVEQW